MFYCTTDRIDAHRFESVEDAEVAASGWMGAAVQAVTLQGLPAYLVTLPTAAYGEWWTGWLMHRSR